MNLSKPLPHFCPVCDSWVKIESWVNGFYIPNCNHETRGDFRELLDESGKKNIKKNTLSLINDGQFEPMKLSNEGNLIRRVIGNG